MPRVFATISGTGTQSQSGACERFRGGGCKSKSRFDVVNLLNLSMWRPGSRSPSGRTSRALAHCTTTPAAGTGPVAAGELPVVHEQQLLGIRSGSAGETRARTVVTAMSSRQPVESQDGHRAGVPGVVSSPPGARSGAAALPGRRRRVGAHAI